MAETLGEKLRLAREERGITLGEVAEQTRISPIYLESIENDDYRNLPGGIFNKGFIRSFAKYVGLNEQEALMDYNRQIAGSETAEETELKVYKPQVLTDDRGGRSMVPTAIVAILILALLSGGILFFVNYLRRPSEPIASNSSRPNNNVSIPANTEVETPAPAGPDMATVKIEFRTSSQPVRLTATTDGTKSDNVVAAGSAATFEPKESLTLNYNRWNATVVQLFINGKQISLPAEPVDNPKAQRIEFTINKDNLAQIWSSGAIAAAPADTSNSNATPIPTPAAPRPTPSARPANVAANTATNTAKPPANTRPAANSPRPVPARTPE